MSLLNPKTVTAKTGELCPVSGVWRPDGEKETAPIAKGNRMPPYKGRAVIWILVHTA
jgi:hypothetical protein